MMIYPELRSIVSDIEPPELPPDPADCAVAFRVLVGPQEESRAEAFSFVVATPRALARAAEGGALWGHGHLVVGTFAWETIVRAIAELLATCARPSWEEVVADLSKELRWEPDYSLTP